MYALTVLLTEFSAIPTPTAPLTVAAAAAVAAAYAIATPNASARINVVSSWAVRLMLPPLPAVVVTSLLSAIPALDRLGDGVPGVGTRSRGREHTLRHVPVAPEPEPPTVITSSAAVEVA